MGEKLPEQIHPPDKNPGFEEFTDWIIRQEADVTVKQKPSIEQNLNAKPEIYFDRRKEIIDETSKFPSTQLSQPITPISRILDDKYNQKLNPISDNNLFSKRFQKQQYTKKSIYALYIKYGIICAVLIILAFIIVKLASIMAQNNI